MEDILTSIRKILSESEDEAHPERPENAADTRRAPEPEPVREGPPVFDLEPAPAAPQTRFDVADLPAAPPVAEPPEPAPFPVQELAPVVEPEPRPDALSGPEPFPEPVPLHQPIPEAQPETQFGLPADDDVFELTEEMAVTQSHAHPEGTGPDERLISSDTEALAGGMIADLASQIARERHLTLGDGSLTLEALVRDILRELLRDWLDQNLPAMTERLVKKEIERLVERAENS
ncbi:DUF2497 domain-containing protein [Phaeovibrio sulfidiphilus]|uniref:DUF2497 domain-containing protein n=1 Tax=Phaeovibrio sulfidiphilus TaxID=1220600 RepID=A0A8J6YLR1_9PROT|nr:DUF2497 domain-containing protein [Phaeovibrio sulfidiphilus]